MERELREYFDEQLEAVLGALPPSVHELLEKVPLVVEDYPSREMLRSVGVRRKNGLCGLYTGVPLTERSVDQPATPSDVIHLFRRGILALAMNRKGDIDEDELRKQIRITILHELGHYHGFGENELDDLGY